MSAQSASTRLARLLALVPYLLSRPGSRVEDVAQAFDIAEEQLLDDLQLLFVCGLPGHMPDDLIEASFEGGVIHVGNADAIARPLRLGADEALALLVGLRTLASVPGLVPGLQDRDALDRALAKLEQAAGDAAAAAENVAVDVEPAPGALPVARAALERGRRLHLRYYVPARDEVTERDVDPMRLLVVDGRTYLEGWCRRVEDVRLFRLDRVVEAVELDAAAQVPAQAEPRDVGAGLFQPGEADVAVTLELEPAGRWVAEYYPCEDVEELPGRRLRARLRTAETAWVVRLALRLGGSGRVVDPPELAEAVRNRAKAALDAYV
ncbi:helix-turn-helix transcriptional regulator [Motilibacter aurantiacus]|uniref:helix-turn-helix transcriptional regulator n=1 Tax=Motilibacter aurantiacus TaxID=2714955 RepID=UPI001407AC6C|nr:WYL domain-containing protein [Motilibacter aurantiacus]NHC47331.1 WYL domain-containing protein [Motilibacter aurantiacus]